MKKRILHFLLSINLLSVFILSSFSIAKAETLTPTTTTNYGSYFAETYFSNNGNYPTELTVGFPGLFEVNIPQANGSMFHFHYDFDNKYSGTLTLVVNASNSYNLNEGTIAVNGGFIKTVPNKTQNTTSKTFVIGLYETQVLDFYIFVERAVSLNQAFLNTTTFTQTLNASTANEMYDLVFDIYGSLLDIQDYMSGDMDGPISQILSQMKTELNYEIPLERASAYSFMLDFGDSIHYDHTCPLPYINMDTSKKARAWVYGGRTYLLAYAFDRNIGSLTFDQLFTVGFSGVYNTTQSNASIAPTVVGGYVFTWVEIAFNTGYSGWFDLTPNYAGKIVPLYFNLTVNPISNELAEFIHHDPNNTTYNQLQQIIQQLIALNNEEQYDTTTYDNFITDVSTFFTNLRNWFPSINPFQTDINSTGPFTGDNTHLDETSGLVSTVYTGMTQSFPFLKTFVVLGAVVILMKVFL